MTSADSVALSSSSAPAVVAAPAAAYTPVQSSVQVVSSRLRSNERVHSALRRLQSFLPQAVTDAAVQHATKMSELSASYATPFVTQVDQQLNTAIVTLLSAPARAQAKVSEVDSLAFAYTPDTWKPTYTATRSRALDIVHQAADKVVSLKRSRADPLWERVSSNLAQLSLTLAQIKSVLADSVVEKSNSAMHALQVQERVTELQNKISATLDTARTKGQQARVMSQEILTAVSEMTIQLTSSHLSASQQAMVKTYYTRLLDTVQSLKETLHLTSSAAAEPEGEEKQIEGQTNLINGDELIITEPSSEQQQQEPIVQVQPVSAAEKKRLNKKKQQEEEKKQKELSEL